MDERILCKSAKPYNVNKCASLAKHVVVIIRVYKYSPYILGIYKTNFIHSTVAYEQGLIKYNREGVIRVRSCTKINL